MRDGFIKVAAGTPNVRVADTSYNTGEIISLMQEAAAAGVKVLVLPELCVTAYTCADLFRHEPLLNGAETALDRILDETVELNMLTAVGLPVRKGGRLYNCAAIICRGRLLGLVPKTNIPNYGEFYEKRWFESAPEGVENMEFLGETVPFGQGQVFRCAQLPELCVGVEICEDLWSAYQPSIGLCAAGASIILNLSASNELCDKAEFRRELVKTQSTRLLCGYAYADAGEGESTTDLVFVGHDIVAENGDILAENRFCTGLTISEIDVKRLMSERRRTMSVFEAESAFVTEFSLEVSETELTRHIPQSPFMPEDKGMCDAKCRELMLLQSLGLKKRMEHTSSKKMVVGISGGLDSTLALLVAHETAKKMALPESAVIAVTMPCFGTTDRTKSNAEKMAEQLGSELQIVDIGGAVKRHFEDIGHDFSDHGVVFENAQARERTQVLMDIANGCGAMVVGTGDMSELALGWATYNGDHMSMYGVNAGITKTAIRHIVGWYAENCGDQILADILWDVISTPVSPELLPAQDGEIAQKTEDLVGPYELHDFFLYYIVRWGFAPKKVLRMAKYAFSSEYSQEVISKWLQTFCRRFFSQQFKRSCLPDGPKVDAVSLSPRGDLRMPSDASGKLWQL